MPPTLPTTLVDLAVTDLDIALSEPFGIAGGEQAAARNLLVSARLDGGARGLGEAAPFPAVNGETQELARAAILEVAEALLGWDARAWRALGPWLRERIPGVASARCAIEIAVLDALARHHGIPLWVLFGGASSSLETDLTIPTGSPAAAGSAAARIQAAGYGVIKLKVGGCLLGEDRERIAAVRAAAPTVGLLLDANGGLAHADEALQLLDAARRGGGRVVLFEQPLHKDDLQGMQQLVERAGVPIAADEGASCVADVVLLAREGAAHVINIKIMKSGLCEALDMAAAARACGLGLMIGAMVESPLALGTSASLAAGLGGFSFVDLDTHLFMVDIPLGGGFTQRGPLLDLSGIAAGHGVSPA